MQRTKPPIPRRAALNYLGQWKHGLGHGLVSKTAIFSMFSKHEGGTRFRRSGAAACRCLPLVMHYF